MKNIVNKLAEYYKLCMYEEAKVSAFFNLKRADNIVVKLKGVEKLLQEHSLYYTAQEESSDLTQVMIKAELDKKKQLIYGYMFITGVLDDGTEIYTPLIYADCNIERIGGRINVSVVESSVTFNVMALARLAENTDNRDVIVKEILKHPLTLPLTKDKQDGIMQMLSDLLPNLSVKINREHAVILATIQKGLAGVVRDLDCISRATTAELCDTALLNVLKTQEDFPQSVNPVPLRRLFHCGKLDDSQKKVLNAINNSNMISVTGGPGTGKSNTISAIASSYIMNGKSVLICSKVNTAVDVVANKLNNFSYLRHLKVAVRTGGKEYRKELATLIDNIVSGKCDYHSMQSIYDAQSSEKYYDLRQREIELSKVRDDAQTRLRNENDRNLIKKIFKKLSYGRTYNRAHDEIISIGKEISSLCSSSDLFDYTTVLRARLLSNLQMVKDSARLRRNLIVLQKALLKNDCVADELFIDLLKVFPCWCTTTTEVSSTIPLIAGLFDLVIIDESSQCDIASCFPLLARAKKAIIVGDSKQLKYLSFLSNSVNNANLHNCELSHAEGLIANYRENSMFDFSTFYADENLMLEIQYRGNNPLMSFSNKNFYNSRLQNYKYSGAENSLQVIKCNGKVRGGKPVNHEEVAYIIDFIKQALASNDTHSIGILSPFREQVKYIEKCIASTFTLDEIKKLNILVGTAHSFQGEERDIMLISWTVSNNSPVQNYTFINNPNLFNVAITRADKQVINLHSADIADMPKGLLKSYLSEGGQ